MDPTKLTSVPLQEFSSVQLTGHLNHCFEDYVMPFVLDPTQFDGRFRPESLDSKASGVWMDGDTVAAISFVARRGWSCRLAAMAVAKAYRSKGVGRHIMANLIEQAKERGDKTYSLEVIEQNPPAIRLYEAVGFTKKHRLAGYVRPYFGSKSEELTLIDPLVLNRLMITECDLDLPSTILPETLCARAAPTIAVTLEDKAFALVTDTPSERVVVWSLFTRRELRRQGYGSRLVGALAELFPSKSLMTPVAVPDTLAPEFLIQNGFSEMELSQFEMTLDLTK